MLNEKEKYVEENELRLATVEEARLLAVKHKGTNKEAFYTCIFQRAVIAYLGFKDSIIEKKYGIGAYAK